MISDKIIDIKRSIYDFKYQSTSGVFFILNMFQEVLFAKKCREEFALGFDSSHDSIGYGGIPLDIELIDKFITHIEDKLKLDNKTIIYRASYLGHPTDKIVIFDLSKFWLKYATRRAMLTLFIRCACLYYTKDRSINEALYAYDLTGKIFNSIEFFLEGNTVPKFSDDCRTQIVEKLMYRNPMDFLEK